MRMHLKKDGRDLKPSTIYRYMKLTNSLSVSRKKIHAYPKAPHHKILNLLQRNFNTDAPNKKWSIDISYLFCKDGLVYLCAIKDMYDKSIVSYKVSKYINLDFVMETVKTAVENTPYNKRKQLIIHSDQGWHFRHKDYVNYLSNNRISQSISSKGSSVDNVPIESFFSIIKTECLYLKDDLYLKNVYSVVDDYIRYYNEERLQRKLKELSPIEFRALALK